MHSTPYVYFDVREVAKGEIYEDTAPSATALLPKWKSECTIRSCGFDTLTLDWKAYITVHPKMLGAAGACGTRNHWRHNRQPKTHAAKSDLSKSRYVTIELTLIWKFNLVAAWRCLSKASAIAPTEGSKSFATSSLYHT